MFVDVVKTLIHRTVYHKILRNYTIYVFIKTQVEVQEHLISYYFLFALTVTLFGAEKMFMFKDMFHGCCLALSPHGSPGCL